MGLQGLLHKAKSDGLLRGVSNSQFAEMVIRFLSSFLLMMVFFSGKQKNLNVG